MSGRTHSEYPVTTEVVRDGASRILSEKLSITVPSGAPSVHLLKVMSEYDHRITAFSGGSIKGTLYGTDDSISVADTRFANNPTVSCQLLPEPHNGTGGKVSIEGTPEMLTSGNVSKFVDALRGILGSSSIDRAKADGWAEQLRRTESVEGTRDADDKIVSRISTLHAR